MGRLYECQAALLKKRDTALLAAVLQEKWNFVELLLDGGADRFQKNQNGENALDIANEKDAETRNCSAITHILSEKRKIL